MLHVISICQTGLLIFKLTANKKYDLGLETKAWTFVKIFLKVCMIWGCLIVSIEFLRKLANALTEQTYTTAREDFQFPTHPSGQ